MQIKIGNSAIGEKDSCSNDISTSSYSSPAQNAEISSSGNDLSKFHGRKKVPDTSYFANKSNELHSTKTGKCYCTIGDSKLNYTKIANGEKLENVNVIGHFCNSSICSIDTDSYDIICQAEVGKIQIKDNYQKGKSLHMQKENQIDEANICDEKNINDDKVKATELDVIKSSIKNSRAVSRNTNQHNQNHSSQSNRKLLSTKKEETICTKKTLVKGGDHKTHVSDSDETKRI